MTGVHLNLTEAQARALADELDHPTSSLVDQVKDKLASRLEPSVPHVIPGQISIDDVPEAA